MEKHTIVAVDDDPITRKILEIALEARSYPAKIVCDGKEAIAALQNAHFDLVITDLQMNDVDGFTVLEKAGELSPSTARIVITSSHDVSAAIKAIDIGVDGYQLKPFAVGELLSCIDRAMSKLKSKKNMAVKKQQTSMTLLSGIRKADRPLHSPPSPIWQNN